MHAFHSNWTAPFFSRHLDENYAIEPFELLTTALSALSWQTCGGTISMMCDRKAAQYYQMLGLSKLWNGGVHSVLEDIPPEVDASTFWAAGKLFALRAVDAPVFMLDTDFIVWKPIHHLIGDAKLAAIHRETIDPYVYPNASMLSAAHAFNFAALDWSVPPVNTALSYFGDPAFTKHYTARAIDFMLSCKNADNPLTYMVFAEQRLLSMLAQQAEISMKILSDLPTLFSSQQKFFTHIWGFKQQMRDNPALYTAFCVRCATRLQTSYPTWANILAENPQLTCYFSQS